MKKQSERRCVILAGGPMEPSMQALLRPEDFIIAVDAGVLAAKRFSLAPALCLGDWDSAPKPDADCPCIVLPAQKDDTDTYYAARVAIEKGFAEVLILGGLGGRMDHTLANISTLLFLRKNGVAAVLQDENTWMTVLQNEQKEIFDRPGFYLSVFALEGEARGVFISGAKYALQNAAITESFPIGVSNEILQKSAVIGVENGALLVLLAR